MNRKTYSVVFRFVFQQLVIIILTHGSYCEISHFQHPEQEARLKTGEYN